MLRLRLYPNKKWSLTVPGSAGAFKQKPKVEFWTELIITDKNGNQMEGMLAKTDETGGRVVLDGVNIPNLRRGSKPTVKAFNGQDACDKCPSKTFSWGHRTGARFHRRLREGI